MLLAIDVGNTETVVGMFQGETLTWHWRYSTVGARTRSRNFAGLFGSPPGAFLTALKPLSEFG